MGRKSTTGGVSPLNERIQLRFNWRGKEFRPSLPLKPTSGNLKAALRLRQQIIEEIKLGIFNLEAHFPEYRFIDDVEAMPSDGHAAQDRSFEDWCKLFFEIKGRSTEHSTLMVYKRHMDSYWIREWGPLNPRAITHEKVQKRIAALAKGYTDKDGKTQKPLSRKTQNNILIPLRGVFELICKSLPHIPDPVAGVENLKAEIPPRIHSP